MIKKILFTFIIVLLSVVGYGQTMTITGNGIVIVNGDTTPDITDDTDFGLSPVGTPVTNTYTINNIGVAILFISLPPGINDLGTGTSDFSVTNPLFQINPGSSSSFDVTFSPTSIGIQTVEISITSSDPNDNPYAFNIQAEGITPPNAPDMQIVGNGNIIVDGQTSISAIDNTDFGQIQIGIAILREFTINNTGAVDLFISLPPVINDLGTGTSDFSVTSPDFLVAPGGSTTFNVVFNPSVAGIQTVEIAVTSNDPDENPYTYYVQAEGLTPAVAPEIQVYGAGDENTGILIANNDVTPDVADETDFGLVQNNTTQTHIYTIFNAGTADLDLTTIQVVGSPFFTLDNLPTNPTTLAPGASTTIDVVFSPTTIGTYNSFVQIFNSDNTLHQYSITGESSAVAISGDIMISQYYEGTGNNKWVEIKNISGAVIDAGTYFLALYNDTDIPNINTQAPTANVSIPAMAVNEVLLFRNGGAALPTAGNLGPATQIIATAVCSFVGGNDVILISSTNDATSYANREDIIGDVPGGVWGGVFSFIRGGDNEVPEANFIKANWIELSVGGDVDAANSNTNIALGTQDVGLANWTGSWSNGIDPDRTRNVEITTDYNAADGTFVAGNLIVNANLNLNGGTTNSVIVYNDLTINGAFTIGDQESLVIYGTGTITGNITKLENSTNRADQYDVTYWSSPIVSANLGTVFSSVDPNRIFLYNQDNTSTIDPLDPAYYDVWEIASGAMVDAKGYAADGPTGTTGVHSISFTGVPNSGTISIELSNLWLGDGEPDNDYNLIGNPYPSAIDSDIFLNGNGNIGGTIYLWTHTTPLAGGDYEPNDYATLNLGGGTAPGGGAVLPRIGSSQGFMVASINAGLVNFTSSMQIPDANNQFYKSNNKKDIVEKDRIWLDIATDQGGRNQQLIVFNEKATNGIDHGYDSKGIWGTNTIDFYSDINDGNYVIQGLPPFSANQTVQLGFDTKVAPRTMTISINRMEGVLKSTEIYLVDNFLNVTHDLRAGDYSFEQATTGSFAKRFTLKFASQTLDVDDIVLNGKQFIVSNNFGNIKIRSYKNVKAIKVYDLFGRMLINKNPNLQSFELNTGSIRNGTVLIIEATLENGSVISRKTIKYQ